LIVLDMGSTWQPFLDFVNTSNLEVYRFPRGLGPRDLWIEGHLNRLGSGPFFLSDGDLDYREVPADAFLVLQKTSNVYPWFPKVGLDLRTDNLPLDSESKRVLEWNKGNNEVELESNLFLSSLDTTIAYYPRREKKFYFRPAIRISGSYSATHYPWYEREYNESEEARVYKSLAKSSISSGVEQQTITKRSQTRRQLLILLFHIVVPLIKNRFLGKLLVRILSWRATLR
jgi:hypothetical protein